MAKRKYNISAKIGSGAITVKQVVLKQGRASQTLAHIVVAVYKKAGCAIEDTVIGKVKAIKAILVQVENSAATGLAAAINLILVDGDIIAGVIQKDAAAGKTGEAIIENLQIIKGAAG